MPKTLTASHLPDDQAALLREHIGAVFNMSGRPCRVLAVEPDPEGERGWILTAEPMAFCKGGPFDGAVAPLGLDHAVFPLDTDPVRYAWYKPDGDDYVFDGTCGEDDIEVIDTPAMED